MSDETFDLHLFENLFREEPGNDDAVIVGGYRLCKLVEDDDGHNVLRGVGIGHDYTWTPGWNWATCGNAKKHRPAARRCSCGLYACSDLPALLRTIGAGGPDEVLVGVIGTGELDLAEHGWRAETARIVAISSQLIGRLLKDGNGEVFRITHRTVLDAETLIDLGRKYQVPVVRLNELETIIGRHIPQEEEVSGDR